MNIRMARFTVNEVFTIYLLLTPVASAFKINRKKAGDELDYFPCYNGTIVVMDDATHSLRCTRSLEEAGCDLIFKTTKQTLFIAPSIRNQNFLITSLTRDMCAGGLSPVIGDLFVQDYPTNIYANVWTKEKGVQHINNSFRYKIFDQNKIQITVTTHWSGILVKLFVDCFDQYGDRDTSSTSSRRCVTMKFSGDAMYPIDPNIFTEALQRSIKTTEKITVEDRFMSAAVKSDDGNPIAWAIALSIAFGIIVFVFCMGVWTIANKCRNKRQLSINEPALIENASDGNNVTRLSYNQMEMSPIINVDTNLPISQIISSTPSRRQRSSKYAQDVNGNRNIATIHMRKEERVNDRNEFLENKYTPPYDFDDDDYFFETAIYSKVDKEKAKINRGKIRKNLQGFQVFESPMGENNLKDIVQNTPNHQRSIKSMLTTPSKGRSYDFNHGEDDDLPSGTRKVIAEINRAYNSFEETLQREKNNLQNSRTSENHFENQSTSPQRRSRNSLRRSSSKYSSPANPVFIHPPPDGNFETSSEAIDAMFALDEYETELDSIAESQEIELDISAEKIEEQPSEEYTFQPYAFRGNSQATNNPLYTEGNSIQSPQNNFQWMKFGQGTSDM